MIYSNTEFIALFLAAAVLMQAGDIPWRRAVCLVASLIFLYWAGWATVFILFAVVTLTWFTARFAEKRREMAGLVIVTCVSLIVANLFTWKYWGWVREELGITFAGPIGDFVAEVGLPVGISFYTLQAISYLIDVWRGRARQVGFLDILLFQIFFGQLIAGPIVRYNQLMHQMQSPRRSTPEGIIAGLELFALGYFKKLVLSDRAAQYVDPVFERIPGFDGATILFALILYTVQIWADFSGYIDMGRGAARVCGIRLPQNFRSPYLSVSPSDFWRRWNMTLGTWLRDYLYIPLGGSRAGLGRTVSNLLLTMLIGGLWHGAAWWFVLWGAYHGALLAIQHVWRRVVGLKVLVMIGMPATFLAVIFGWLLFRVQSLGDIGTALKAMAAITPDQFITLLHTRPTTFLAAFLFFGIALFIQFMEINPQLIWSMRRTVQPFWRGAMAGLLICVAIALRGSPVPFIYFQF